MLPDCDFVNNRWILSENCQDIHGMIPCGLAKKYIDRLKEWLIVVDESCRILYANQTAQTDFSEQIIGRSSFEVFHNTKEDSVIWQVMQSGHPRLNYVQTYYASRNGSLKASLASTYPILSGDRVIGVMEVGEDITGYNNFSEQIMHNLILEHRLRFPAAEKSHSEKRYTLSSIIGECPAITEVKQHIIRAANNHSNILIYGATGTGKELAAQAVYSLSNDGKSPFIAQNCAAIPEALLESILFGTVKGAYTGAETREGLFELAGGGVLFLDEINSMPLTLQAKILRVLEERKLRRLGSVKETPVNFRLIVAMNQDPYQLMQEGKIRSDLYYRLNVLRINLPPLRERLEDIPLLIQHFIKEYNQAGSARIEGIDSEAMKILMNYGWPGNVRELKNVMERAFYQCEDGIIAKRHISQDQPPTLHPAAEPPASDLPKLRDIIRQTEIDLICRALEKNHGNVSRSARELGVPQQTLDSKIKKYGIRDDIRFRHR